MGNAGSAIKIMREAQELSQRELGRLAGVSAGYLSRVESGQEFPSKRWLRAVTDALGRHLAGADA